MLSFQSALFSEETRPALISLPCAGVFSLRLSGTRKDRACQSQGSVFNISMTAIKTVNITAEPRVKKKKKEDFSGASVGRGDQPYAYFSHPSSYRNPFVSTSGTKPAETRCPNQELWAQVESLGIVRVSPLPRGSGSCVHRDHVSALYLQCVLFPLRFSMSELRVLP